MGNTIHKLTSKQAKKMHRNNKIAKRANSYIVPIEMVTKLMVVSKRYSLYQCSEYNQNTRIDLPVVGLNTVHLLKKYDYEGIFLEKNNCILLEKTKVINYCNKSSLFIFGVNKI